MKKYSKNTKKSKKFKNNLSKYIFNKARELNSQDKDFQDYQSFLTLYVAELALSNDETLATLINELNITPEYFESLREQIVAKLLKNPCFLQWQLNNGVIE